MYASSKRQKTSSKSKSSSVAFQLGSLTAQFISDEELSKWKHRDPEEENSALIRASCEIFLYSLNRKSNMDRVRMGLQDLEFEKPALSKQVSEITNKLSKTEKALTHKDDFYKKRT